MSEEHPKSDILKTVEDNRERMEVGEISEESDKVDVSIPPSSSSASKDISADSGDALASDPATSPPELPDQQSAVEPGSSPKTTTADEKKPGFFKTVKKACKNVLTKISPRKHDKAPFVPEGATEVPADVPSTAAVASGGKSKPPKGRRGTLTVDSPTSEGRTLITEMSTSSDENDFPEDAARKASVASSDTAAHISMLSNLEESSLAKETGDKAKSPDEENKESCGDSDIPMEAD